MLDAHVSGRAVGVPLREAGHDVVAIDADPNFFALHDTDLLAVAAREQRVLVTFNVRDFARIVRNWADQGRHHGGCIFVVGLDHREFGVVLRGLTRILAKRIDPASWQDTVEYLSRAMAQP